MLRKFLKKTFTDSPIFKKDASKNVLGGDLKPCCFNPMTGFYRDGFCNTGKIDFGRHLVCVEITEEFLKFSKASGNDLSTPVLGMFPGLKEGDKWCVCVLRWKEAFLAGKAPRVVLESTHEKALEYVEGKDLIKFAADIRGDIGE